MSELLNLYILDALMDSETIELLLDLLNSGWQDAWGRPFERNEVLEALKQMVADSTIEVMSVDSVDWFGRTALGQAKWDAWSP